MPTARDTQQFYRAFLGFEVDEDYWLQSIWAHEADDDKLAERINNDLQHMWRAGSSAGLAPSHPAMRAIDAVLKEWVEWWADYKTMGSSLARAWDPFDWYTTSHEELQNWALRMEKLVKKLVDMTPQIESELSKRNVQESVQEYADAVRAERSSEAARTTRFLVGFIGAAGLLGLGAWIAVKASR